MGGLIDLRRDLAAASRLLRMQNWWYAKIPTLLTVFYALQLTRSPGPAKSYLALAGILISLTSLFSFGYVVNDVFDVEQDRRAGRVNEMAGRSMAGRAGLCILLVAGAFLPWLWMPFGRTAALLLAANLALPLAYSVPPLRLKERGFYGIVCDALMVHLLPTLFTAAVINHVASGLQTQGLRLAAVAAAWAFFFGLRGILIHQIQDRENDRRAGVRTLAVISDPRRLRILGMACFTIEMSALATFVLLLFYNSPLPLFIAVCYAAFDVARHIVWRMSFDPVPQARGTYVPPADLNEVWLPLSLAVSMAAQDLHFLPIAFLHVVLFSRDVARRKYEVTALRIESRRRHWETTAQENDQ